MLNLCAFRRQPPGVVTLEHGRAFPLTSCGGRPLRPDMLCDGQNIYDGLVSTKARNYISSGAPGARIYGSWGSGTYKVTAKAKYATKYRTVPYYGNVTRDVTVGYSYNRWTSQYPDINRTKSRPTMTCRRSDGLERSWYDPWYDSPYYDPEFRPVADDFNSNRSICPHLYYSGLRSERNHARNEQPMEQRAGTYDEFYGWKVKTLNRNGEGMERSRARGFDQLPLPVEGIGPRSSGSSGLWPSAQE